MEPTDSPTSTTAPTGGSAQFPACSDTVTVNCIPAQDYYPAAPVPTVVTTPAPALPVPVPATVAEVGTVAPDLVLAHTGVPTTPYVAVAVLLVLAGALLRRVAR